jgi:DNA-directed RNA polymerase specialized sigma24 family protein
MVFQQEEGAMLASEETCRVWIEALKRQEEWAWEELDRMVRSQVQKCPVAGITGPDDLAQEALIRIRNAIGEFQPDQGRGTIAQNFRAWVHVILKRLCLTALKEARRHVSFSAVAQGLQLPANWKAQLADDPAAVADLLAQREGLLQGVGNDPERGVAFKEIMALVHDLSTDEKRMAAGYHFILGYTIEETAQLMHKDFAAMNTLLMRDIKNELRGLAQQRGIDVHYLRLWESSPLRQAPPVKEDEPSEAAGEG